MMMAMVVMVCVCVCVWMGEDLCIPVSRGLVVSPPRPSPPPSLLPFQPCAANGSQRCTTALTTPPHLSPPVLLLLLCVDTTNAQ